MRALHAILGLAILVTPVFADDREVFQQVASAVRASLQGSTVRVQLLAEEKHRGKVNTFRVELAFQRAAGEKPDLLELWTYRNNRPERRFVADGEHFWVHNIRERTFGSVSYPASGDRDNSVTGVLFQMLQAHARGYEVPVARLIAETAKRNIQWNPWMPLARVAAVTQDVAAIQDPLVEDWVYTGTENQWVAYFESGEPVQQTMAVVMELSNGMTGRLIGMYGAEVADVRSLPRLRTWQLTAYPDDPLDGADFTFVPPVDARPIAIGAKGGG